MNLFKRFTDHMEVVGRARTLQVLRQLSDRQLEDAGISQELLSQGLKAWPWRVEDDVVPANLQLDRLVPVPGHTLPAANAPQAGSDRAPVTAVLDKSDTFDTAA